MDIPDLNAWLQQKTQEIDQAIQGAGINTEAGAKQACPVDTGRLRASIAYTPDTLACSVGTNVEYALPVELGHHTRSGSFVPAQPFLFPASVQAGQELLQELKDIFSS